MKSKKVIIADDEFTTRRILERLIRDNFRCRLQTADDGSEAIKLMIKEVPDLLILDMVMPVMNGLQVLKMMRENAKLSKVPVIACTAVDDDSIVKEIIKFGVKDYIKKPIEPDSIVQKITAVLDL
jgi:putative two-component system response regulator